MYFKTEEEMNQYFPNGVPSNVICIVGENEAIYTSSNNYISEGVPVSQGGDIETPEQKAEYAYATALSGDIRYGDTPSTLEVEQ